MTYAPFTKKLIVWVASSMMEDEELLAFLYAARGASLLPSVRNSSGPVDAESDAHVVVVYDLDGIGAEKLAEIEAAYLRYQGIGILKGTLALGYEWEQGTQGTPPTTLDEIRLGLWMTAPAGVFSAPEPEQPKAKRRWLRGGQRADEIDEGGVSS